VKILSWSQSMGRRPQEPLRHSADFDRLVATSYPTKPTQSSPPWRCGTGESRRHRCRRHVGYPAGALRLRGCVARDVGGIV
jgi:hypothetical protein